MGASSSSREEVKLGAYIGSGTFAVVYKAQWNGKTVAAKKLRSYMLHKNDIVKRFEDEWQTLRDLNHPNIVRYYTVILPQRAGDSTIIITELLDGDLGKLIQETKRANRNRQTLPFSETVKIMMDVSSGLEYLHGKGIVHRDIASRNILLDSARRAKIADLGLAKLFPQGRMQATANPGCMACRAPETFGDTQCGSTRKVNYGASADVFSFGTVLLEAIIGHGPEQLSAVKTEDGRIVPEHIRRSADILEMGTEHPLRDLVLGCLSNVPENRPKAREILHELRTLNQQNDVMRSRDKLPGPRVHRVVTYDPHYDHSFKVMLLGSLGVGKTSIIQRFVDPTGELTSSGTTLALSERFERLQMKGQSILLQLTDTMGETGMHSLTPQMYRGTTGAVLVFDLSDWDTLYEVPQWIELLQKHCHEDVPLVLVANKDDMLDASGDKRKEIRTAAQQLAERHGILMYFEVSAKTGMNIEETFSALIETLIERDNAHRAREEHADGRPSRTTRGGKLPIPAAAMTGRQSLPPTVVLKDPDSIIINGDPPRQNEGAHSRRSCPC